jgi:hypothetical protein
MLWSFRRRLSTRRRARLPARRSPRARRVALRLQAGDGFRARREALAWSHAHYGDDADRIQEALNGTAATPPPRTTS